MRLCFVVVCCSLLAACGGEDERFIAAKSAVEKTLLDPSSAQFRNMHIAKLKPIVCGEVNAKNRMGGYVGFKRFHIASGELVMEPNEITEINQDAVAVNNLRGALFDSADTWCDRTS